MNLQDIKNRFGIIGNSPLLNRALDVAQQVAPTDITVLITGESGTGKEVFSQIIHQLGTRRHGNFIAVNCGAIPEGTIDSELFGHEKGSFTGAHDARKGYFEEVGGGTIFLDEVAELPIGTQARLLRVLETGEYLRVGSSKVQKTNVRVIAATHVDLTDAVNQGTFREDLYYRLSTIPIHIPALRERKEDIYLLFRKFIADFSEKYKTPHITLSPEAEKALLSYYFPGNIRQLKNIAEQIAILEKEHEVSEVALLNYLPNHQPNPSLIRLNPQKGDDLNERDLLYKVLFDMKRDMVELKKLVFDLLNTNPNSIHINTENRNVVDKLYEEIHKLENSDKAITIHQPNPNSLLPAENYTATIINDDNESLSLVDKEIAMIKIALKKYAGKRKLAAQELGISERTLYRKIKELEL